MSNYWNWILFPLESSKSQFDACVNKNWKNYIFTQVFPILFFIEYFYMPTIKVRINEILYPTTRENGYGSLLYSCWHWVCCYHTSAINRCMTHGLFSISRNETHWSWIFFRLMSILYHYIFILHKTCYHECCCICP